MRSSLALCACLIASLTSLAGAEVRQVIPPEYETVEAPSGSFATGVEQQGSWRLQFLIDSDAFANVPATHRKITGFYLRPDGVSGFASTAAIANMEIRLSTAAVELDEMNITFQSNVGSDETVVYDGPLTISTAYVGPRRGPKEFDIAFLFEDPFLYTPSRGNLLVDLITTGPWGWVGHDHGDSAMVRSLGSDDASSLTGEEIDNDSFVMSFAFVPEPNTALACALGVAMFAGCRRRVQAGWLTNNASPESSRSDSRATYSE